MAKTPRPSPPYPAISVAEAVRKVRPLVERSRDGDLETGDALDALGYTSLSGSATSMINSLRQYGLVERRGEDVRATKLARDIVEATSPAKEAASLAVAAWTPEVFKKLRELFGSLDLVDSEIHKYLDSQGFLAGACDKIVSAYRRTILDTRPSAEQARLEERIDDANVRAERAGMISKGVIFDYRLAGGGSLKLVLEDDTELHFVLRFVESWINLKRLETRN